MVYHIYISQDFRVNINYVTKSCEPRTPVNGCSSSTGRTYIVVTPISQNHKYHLFTLT